MAVGVCALLINSIGWAKRFGAKATCTVPSVDSVQVREPQSSRTPDVDMYSSERKKDVAM